MSGKCKIVWMSGAQSCWLLSDFEPRPPFSPHQHFSPQICTHIHTHSSFTIDSRLLLFTARRQSIGHRPPPPELPLCSLCSELAFCPRPVFELAPLVFAANWPTHYMTTGSSSKLKHIGQYRTAFWVF